LESSRQRLSYWDIEEVHWKDLERDRRVLRALPIHSPSSGYVVEKDVVAGAHVSAGQRLYRLADLDRVWVLADIYEYELPQVSVGQQAEVTLSYLPGQTFRGRITYVYPYLEAAERTVKIRVELANPGHRLKEGMYADVALSSRRTDVLMVPTEAVIDSGTRQVVFLDLGDGRFEPRAVELGARFDEGYEILGGLEAGDRIVTSANFLIDSESQLAAGMGQMQH
jgi:Cu(I)/Ag(I) efflux system membrane fusion protein